MKMDITKSLLQLTEIEYQMVIDGLDELKNKGFAGEIMGMMFDAALKPGKEATAEQLKAWEEVQRKRELEKMERDRKAMEFKRDVEILKSKLILLAELKRKEEFRTSSKKLHQSNPNN
jgi:hypothetical protein